MPRWVMSSVFVLALYLLVLGLTNSRFSGGTFAAPAQVKHGLTGSYYVSTLETHSDTRPSQPWFVQVWYDPNDFRLPRPFTAPAAVRVDPNIAFGNGNGFVTPGNKRLIWAPTGYATPAGWNDPKSKPWEYQGGTIWKGFIHLPGAGTYYLSTVSNGASAVYLNKARVALNGVFGGVLVSDAFSYNKEDVRDYIQYVAAGREDVGLKARQDNSYIVPVTIDGPRDLPIEVRYNSWMGANQGTGIDLFWVTPHSPRDAKGKPIAQIVPSEALYVEPPGPIATPAVRSANSTISADFLYFPTEYTDQSVTITIRLADKDGNPVAGKRVHVYSLTSYGNADTITQPEKPTDENGITTAKLRAGEGHKVKHDSTILAIDVTDLVDVAQVAHVSFEEVPNSFFPDSFSPYYDDGKFFSIEPLPLIEGRPVTVRVTLQNRGTFSAEVTATLYANDWNVGSTSWNQIGKQSDIRLQPGEVKEVKTTWVPGKSTHQCFKAEVAGRYIASSGARTEVLEATLVPTVNLVRAAAAPVPANAVLQMGGFSLSGGKQRNIGPVSPKTDYGFDKPYWADVEEHTKDVRNFMLGAVGAAFGVKGVLEAGPSLSPEEAGGRVILAGKNPIVKKVAGGILIVGGILAGEMAVIGGLAHKIANDPPDPAFQEVYTPYDYQLPSLARLETVPEEYAAAFDALARNQLEIVSLSNAVLVSLERYQGAKNAGNQDAADKQLLAYTNYTSEVAQAFERGAHLIENLVVVRRASGMPDIVLKADQIRAAQQRLASNGFSDDLLAVFAWLGVSEEFLKEQILPAAMSADPNRAAGNYEEKLLELAALYRWAGAGLARKSSLTYLVGNPHEREETIDLFIRPISIPPDWKLTIVNPEHVETATEQKTRVGAPPRYPLQVIEAGKHYALTLPAKTEIKVASVLVPIGELGARTTARWAVEGRISNELIGGMVHEMTVPYTIADLKQPSRRGISYVGVIAVVVALLVLATFAVLMIARRRRTRVAP